MTNYNYAGWSARQLKDAGQSVDAGPLFQVAQLLADGVTQAARINTGLQAALKVLMPGWSGQAAAQAHARTTGLAQNADSRSTEASLAQATAQSFAENMTTAKAQVGTMAASDPPQASDYLFPWGLLSPAGATAAYLYSAHQAENQRQALVAQITAMDTQGRNAGAGLVDSFTAQSIKPQPPPRDLPPKKVDDGSGGVGSGRSAPTVRGSDPGASTPSPSTTATGAPPATPGTTAPGSTGQTGPEAGGTTSPEPSTGATVPGAPAVPAAGTLPQSFTPAAGATALPSSAVVPGVAGAAGGAGGLGAALLGGAAATGGASAALGSAGVGLPGTVRGGWAPGGAAPRPGSAVPLGGAMRPGPGAASPASRRTVGRGGVLRSGTGEPPGTRPGVLPAGQAAGGRAGGVAAGRATGARGAAGPAGRRRRDEDPGLAGRPDYLVESDDVWGDGRTVARGVLGQRPDVDGEGTDTP